MSSKSSAASQMRGELRKRAPAATNSEALEAELPQAGLAFSGSLATTRSCYHEHLALGSLRFLVTGNRELVVFNYGDLREILQASGNALGKSLAKMNISEATEKKIMELGSYMCQPPGS
eukprot:767547-Alexandrium_andersonii.AAC.1